MADKKPAAKAAPKKSTAKKVPPVKPAKQSEKLRPEGYTVNPKLPRPDKVLEAYDNLIDILAKEEASQRIKKKPYRLYFFHRKRAEVMRLNFIKSLR